jgi:hypothetical protein
MSPTTDNAPVPTYQLIGFVFLIILLIVLLLDIFLPIWFGPGMPQLPRLR